jgi:branched-chain amino acid transport system permease protein
MTSPATPAPAVAARWRELQQQPAVKRFEIFVVLGLLLAVMSGPQGRLGHPTYGITHAFGGAHVAKCLGIALGAWVVATAWLYVRTPARRTVRTTVARLNLEGNRNVRWGRNLVLLGIAIVLPLVGPASTDYWQGTLVESMGIYALLAIGLNVVVGFAGLLDLGYVAFYAIGAYTTAYFTGALPVQPPATLNPFYVIPLSIIAAMIAGLVLGAPTLRLRGDYLAIVTLGFGEIVTIIAVNLDSITNGSRGATGIPSFSVHIGGLNYNWGLKNLPYYYLLLAFLVTIFVLFSLLEDSRVGRAWTAIREDEVAAQACGIPTVKYKLLAFTIGASTSGFAGTLYASKIGYIAPSDFGLSFSILVLALVIFGGMGSIIGAAVGAAVLQFIQAYLLKHNTIDPADLFIYIGAVLIVMMIFRPQGIIPSRRRAREIGLAEHGIGGADALGAPAGSPTS